MGLVCRGWRGECTGFPTAEMNSSDVHIFPLNLDEGDLASACSVLAREELERAEKFHFEIHRNRFIRGRAALRRLLGQHMRLEPAQIALKTLHFGKPAIAHSSTLAFNLAHSEQCAVIVLGVSRELGIDVELARPLVDRDALADRNFSAEECLALRNAPVEQRDQLFFHCWTRKEAHLKMLGTGIADDLRAITVGLTNGSRQNVLTVLHTFEISPDACASVASDSPWAALKIYAPTAV